MNTFDIARKDGSETELEIAMDAVGESVKEFSDAYLARLSAKSTHLGKGKALVETLKSLRAELSKLLTVAAETYKVRAPEHIKLEGQLVKWLHLFDGAVAELEKTEMQHNASSRDVRRGNAEHISVIRLMRTNVEEMREMVLSYLELVDPTPDNYLEEEIRRIHGADADRVIAGFTEIAASENFTLDAVKHRHNLK